MKPMLFLVGVFVALHFPPLTQCHAQQSDTSSFFPLGLWGIWIDATAPPLNPPSALGVDWTKEGTNWTDINGNYLVWWIPRWVESNVMAYADSHGYRVDIANWNYDFGFNDSSLISWVANRASDTTIAINTINRTSQQWGNHPGFYTYAIGHENLVTYDSYWPFVEFACRKISELDPSRRSCLVAVGAPPQGFLDAVPHLDVYQSENGYLFTSAVGQSYSDQQSVLDQLLTIYLNPTMAKFRGKHSEWHSLIQAHRANLSSPPDFRRPSIFELRAQAYSALSRGARGITSFVYGSWLTNSNPPVTAFWGLVNDQRNKINADIDPDGQAAFDNLAAVYNEIRMIGPTLRKLRIYDAFPQTGIPGDNIAKITSVTGDVIEIGVFKRIDQGSDSTAYFMLVNRKCNNQDGSVSAQQTITTSFQFPSGNREITDVANGNVWIIKSDGTMTDEIQPGAGKLYKIGPATFTSTKLVPAGKTLIIGPGAIASFGNQASLTVSGTLSAVGTPVDRITLNSSSGTWGGIIFNSGSSGSLQYCDVSNATTGIRICGTAAPTVRYCNLSNISTTGIYLDGANVQLKIDNNTISSNTCGVYSYFSNSTLELNTIFGAWEGVSSYGSYDRMSNNSITTWEYGVYSGYYSQTSLLGRLYGYAGNNRILYAGSVALYADFGSEILAGQYSWNQGLNSFYDGGIDPKAVAGDNSTIIAQYNWWDSDHSSYGNVDNSNPLDYDPNAGMRAGGNPVANSLSSQLVPGDSAKGPSLLDAELLSVRLTMDQGKYDEAITQFFDKYKKETNLQKKKYALARLADCHILANRADFVDFLNVQIRPSLIKSDELFVESLELEGNSLIRNGQYAKAASVMETIKSDYSDSPGRFKHALFNLANLYSSHLGEFGKAAENVGLLKSQYPNDILTRLAQSTTSAVVAPSKANLTLEEGKKEAPREYALRENYPNPFNPSTVIPFSIPNGGHVTLDVYNSLGQKVASLVDAEIDAGYHEVKFDASRLASGVYFYRLHAGNFVQTRKLLLLR